MCARLGLTAKCIKSRIIKLRRLARERWALWNFPQASLILTQWMAIACSFTSSSRLYNLSNQIDCERWPGMGSTRRIFHNYNKTLLAIILLFSSAMNSVLALRPGSRKKFCVFFAFVHHKIELSNFYSPLVCYFVCGWRNYRKYSAPVKEETFLCVQRAQCGLH